jgi:hypothetical protein
LASDQKGEMLFSKAPTTAGVRCKISRERSMLKIIGVIIN